MMGLKAGSPEKLEQVIWKSSRNQLFRFVLTQLSTFVWTTESQTDEMMKLLGVVKFTI